jgi:dUTP pyrophosphatase
MSDVKIDTTAAMEHYRKLDERPRFVRVGASLKELGEDGRYHRVRDPGMTIEVDAPPFVRVKLTGAGARVPMYQTPGSVGCDLHAFIADELWIHAGERRVVDTGVCIELPDGFEAQVRGRSGLCRDHGIVANLGTIDQDYRGPIGVQLVNHGDRAFRIAPGDRIGQLVIAPVVRATFEVVNELGDTDRGAGGFGSTGVR